MLANFKSIKVLEWCTKLPSGDFPMVSPVCLLKGCDCLFRCILEKESNGWFYNTYVEVKKKSEHSKLLPCKVNIRVGFKKELDFSLGQKTITVDAYKMTEIWYKGMDSLRSKLPKDYAEGNWIKYWVNFEDVDGYISEDIKEIGLQTPSYISNSFLMEEISKDFSKLSEENSYHDVVFTCGDQTIKAHKSVLCCRSDVFASMLQSDMVEGKTGQVNIQDIEASIFKQLLECLYTGSLPNLTVDTALKFYEASDKYNVVALKKQCAEFLIDNLSPDIACNILILADRHNDPDFKKDVLDYFMQEKIPYMGEMWTDFCNSYSKLSIEVLNLFCQYLRPKPT